jgi:aminobenzoyl-glutamate utilization protein B
MDQHFNKSIAETMSKNIVRVGMPKWDNNDLTLARALQRELGVRETGLDTTASAVRPPNPNAVRMGGGSDDIGDVSWVVPTVTLRYPSNIPGGPGHNWANAIAMATPIAHKGALQGAKVQALTLLDIFMTPKVVADAWDYFNNVQTKDRKYTPFIRPIDQPAIWLNAEIMARYREQMRPFYYDPSKFKTYLEQLGIRYPTVRGITQ